MHIFRNEWISSQSNIEDIIPKLKDIFNSIKSNSYEKLFTIILEKI